MNHRGTFWRLAPSVKVCVTSCQSVEPQLNLPTARAEGESMAMTGPKHAPSPARPASPTVRTEKSAWSG